MSKKRSLEEEEFEKKCEQIKRELKRIRGQKPLSFSIFPAPPLVKLRRIINLQFKMMKLRRTGF